MILELIVAIAMMRSLASTFVVMLRSRFDRKNRSARRSVSQFKSRHEGAKLTLT